jgi:nucleotide-binding universal stress UspA family protein
VREFAAAIREAVAGALRRHGIGLEPDREDVLDARIVEELVHELGAERGRGAGDEDAGHAPEPSKRCARMGTDVHAGSARARGIAQTLQSHCIACSRCAGPHPEVPRSMVLETLLVPIDFSRCSEQALDYACELADKVGGATIHLVHALGIDVPDLGITITEHMIKDLEHSNRAAVEAVVRARPKAKFATPVIRSGDARDAILDTAERIHADLIIMGTHGRRGITRAVLGSVAESVVRRATCPVLTVRAKKE